MWYTFLHSVEFYVVMTVIAAAVIALSARPSNKGPVIKHHVEGDMVPDMPVWFSPGLRIRCNESGTVTLRRVGLDDCPADTMMYLTVDQHGFDLEITEHCVRGYGRGEECGGAVFTLAFLAQERYHVKYIADPSTRMAAFTLHVRPGLTMEVELRD